MFSKFKIEKPPNVLYKRGPRHFEVEQSALSLPLLEVYDQRIRHLCAENEQLRAQNNGRHEKKGREKKKTTACAGNSKPFIHHSMNATIKIFA